MAAFTTASRPASSSGARGKPCLHYPRPACPLPIVYPVAFLGHSDFKLFHPPEVLQAAPSGCTCCCACAGVRRAKADVLKDSFRLEQLDKTVVLWCRGKEIALDVARGLSYLHSQRIAHLDIKSGNVLLTRYTLRSQPSFLATPSCLTGKRHVLYHSSEPRACLCK